MSSPPNSRSDTYRYFVDRHGAELTPLASIEAFIGNLQVRVLNISMGGMAIILERQPEFLSGDVIDVSVAIRGRPFPMQVEVKSVRGLRVSFAFIEPPPAFGPALREFLAPKYLGDSLKLNELLKDLPAALELVLGSVNYEAYVGENQTGVFVWMGEGRSLIQMLSFSRDLVVGWDSTQGLRTGRLADSSGQQDATQQDASLKEDVQWDRVTDITVLHYLADILLAWMGKNAAGGREFVEKLLSPSEDASAPKFPQLG